MSGYTGYGRRGFRVRLILEGVDSVEGYRRKCFFYINIYRDKYVRNVLQRIWTCFYSKTCESGDDLYLSMDEFFLPPEETSLLLSENDTINVRVRPRPGDARPSCDHHSAQNVTTTAAPLTNAPSTMEVSVALLLQRLRGGAAPEDSALAERKRLVQVAKLLAAESGSSDASTDDEQSTAKPSSVYELTSQAGVSRLSQKLEDQHTPPPPTAQTRHGISGCTLTELSRELRRRYDAEEDGEGTAKDGGATTGEGNVEASISKMSEEENVSAEAGESIIENQAGTVTIQCEGDASQDASASPNYEDVEMYWIPSDKEVHGASFNSVPPSAQEQEQREPTTPRSTLCAASSATTPEANPGDCAVSVRVNKVSMNLMADVATSPGVVLSSRSERVTLQANLEPSCSTMCSLAATQEKDDAVIEGGNKYMGAAASLKESEGPRPKNKRESPLGHTQDSGSDSKANKEPVAVRREGDSRTAKSVPKQTKAATSEASEPLPAGKDSSNNVTSTKFKFKQPVLGGKVHQNDNFVVPRPPPEATKDERGRTQCSHQSQKRTKSSSSSSESDSESSSEDAPIGNEKKEATPTQDKDSAPIPDPESSQKKKRTRTRRKRSKKRRVPEPPPLPPPQPESIMAPKTGDYASRYGLPKADIARYKRAGSVPIAWQTRPKNRRMKFDDDGNLVPLEGSTTEDNNDGYHDGDNGNRGSRSYCGNGGYHGNRRWGSEGNRQWNSRGNRQWNPQGSREWNTQGNTQGNRGWDTQGNREWNTQRNREWNTQGNREWNTQGNRESNTEENSERTTEENRESNTEGSKEWNTQGNMESNTQGNRELNTEDNRELNTEENRESKTEENSELNTEGTQDQKRRRVGWVKFSGSPNRWCWSGGDNQSDRTSREIPQNSSWSVEGYQQKRLEGASAANQSSNVGNHNTDRATSSTDRADASQRHPSSGAEQEQTHSRSKERINERASSYNCVPPPTQLRTTFDGSSTGHGRIALGSGLLPRAFMRPRQVVDAPKRSQVIAEGKTSGLDPKRSEVRTSEGSMEKVSGEMKVVEEKKSGSEGKTKQAPEQGGRTQTVGKSVSHQSNRSQARDAEKNSCAAGKVGTSAMNVPSSTKHSTGKAEHNKCEDNRADSRAKTPSKPEPQATQDKHKEDSGSSDRGNTTLTESGGVLMNAMVRAEHARPKTYTAYCRPARTGDASASSGTDIRSLLTQRPKSPIVVTVSRLSRRLPSDVDTKGVAQNTDLTHLNQMGASSGSKKVRSSDVSASRGVSKLSDQASGSFSSSTPRNASQDSSRTPSRTQGHSTPQNVSQDSSSLPTKMQVKSADATPVRQRTYLTILRGTQTSLTSMGHGTEFTEIASRPSRETVIGLRVTRPVLSTAQCVDAAQNTDMTLASDILVLQHPEDEEPMMSSQIIAGDSGEGSMFVSARTSQHSDAPRSTARHPPSEERRVASSRTSDASGCDVINPSQTAADVRSHNENSPTSPRQKSPIRYPNESEFDSESPIPVHEDVYTNRSFVMRAPRDYTDFPLEVLSSPEDDAELFQDGEQIEYDDFEEFGVGSNYTKPPKDSHPHLEFTWDSIDNCNVVNEVGQNRRLEKQRARARASEGGEENGGDAPPSVVKDEQFYCQFPLMSEKPRPRDIIAFKCLEMDENYCPCVTEYQEASVIGVSDAGVISLSMIGYKPTLRRRGRFEIFSHDDDEIVDLEEEAGMVDKAWAELIQPRLLHP